MRYSLAFSHARANAPENRQAVIDGRKVSIAATTASASFVPIAPIVELHPKGIEAPPLEPAFQGALAELERKLGALQSRLDALSKNGRNNYKEFLDDANYVLNDASLLFTSMKPSLAKDDRIIENDPAMKKKFAMTSLMLDITLHRLSEW